MKKVYMKKQVYDWGSFVFLQVLVTILLAGTIVAPIVGARVFGGIMLFLLMLFINLGLMVQLSDTKEIEIGYVKEDLLKKK